jgi:hypothetical protein
MPRYTDLIATMPTDELNKHLLTMKQERNRALKESDRIFDNAINREKYINDYTIINGLLGSKIRSLDRKIHKATQERSRRDIQEQRAIEATLQNPSS